ncbi:MAG: MBOAT family O-acyltransferase [Myxococcota bacterium]
MLFNSALFGTFFVAIFLLNFRAPHRLSNWLLLAASYTFYAAWNWKFLVLIWVSTLLDYVVGRVIGGTENPGTRRLALLVSLVGNLTLLGFFKYYNFFIDSLDLLLGQFGMSAASLHLDLVLPLGISFYTLQTMSYAVDVYRGKVEPVRSLRDFGLYVCFFPQLVAGPIERAHQLIPQIQRPRRITSQDLQEGVVLAAWGVFKKVVVADNLARIVDPVYAMEGTPSGLDALLAALAFTFQLYADFSSYSDIARGTARMLGFHLTLNFETPFFSRDMGEFWRRWHITLSTWLRDYLYLPLGGNRRSEPRVAFNLMTTLLLAGLWHGSDGTYFLFGIYHGAMVVLARWYRMIRPVREESPLWPGAVVSVILFGAGLVFMRAATVEQSATMFGAMFFDLHWDPDAWLDVATIIVAAAPVLLFDVFHHRTGSDLFVLSWPVPARLVALLAVFYGIVLFGRADQMEFVYFQF